MRTVLSYLLLFVWCLSSQEGQHREIGKLRFDFGGDPFRFLIFLILLHLLLFLLLDVLDVLSGLLLLIVVDLQLVLLFVFVLLLSLLSVGLALPLLVADKPLDPKGD